MPAPCPLLLLLLLGHRAAAAVVPPHPVPPRQSPFQRDAVAAGAARAAALSAAARPQLLAFLGSGAVQRELAACCADVLPSAAPAALLSALRREIGTAELVHNFKAAVHDPREHIVDVDLAQARAFEFLPNGWQLQYLKLANTSGGGESPEDSGETGIFGAREFSGPGWTPASWTEASDRLVYTALNTRRVAAGNPMFGSVSMVFNRAAVANMTLVAGSDTGLWEFACNKTGPGRPGHHGPGLRLNCSALPTTVNMGTLEHLDHLILANLGFWNGTLHPFQVEAAVRRSPSAVMTTSTTTATSFSAAPPLTLEQRFGRLVRRIFAPWGHVPNITASDVIQYLEANLFGQALFPDAVQFVIADFGALFGTDLGTRLRAWCNARGWLLVWSLGLNDYDGKTAHSPPHPNPNPSMPSNQRTLDASVLVGTGGARVAKRTQLVDGGAVVAQQAALWSNVSAARKKTATAGRRWSGAKSQAWWFGHGMGHASGLAVEPLRPDRCSGGPASCIGTRLVDSSCVCYSST